jgi:hypothetical protein
MRRWLRMLFLLTHHRPLGVPDNLQSITGSCQKGSTDVSIPTWNRKYAPVKPDVFERRTSVYLNVGRLLRNKQTGLYRAGFIGP